MAIWEEWHTFATEKRTVFNMQTLKTDTRKRILDVSKRLFLKKGFRETTTRDIAREAGINLSNLYHYFASKDELFRQLLKPATDTLKAMKEKHPEINTGVSDFFIHLNNVWMFTLLEEILMHNLTEEEVRSVLSDYVRFEVLGWRKMIQI